MKRSLYADGPLGPSPAAASTAVSKSMRGNTGRDTKPELFVRQLLREMGFRGYRLHWAKVPGRPDIAYPGRRIAIFVNGCFWHRCPLCHPSIPRSHSDFWAKKFSHNVMRDERKVRELRAMGWSVTTIWECELDDVQSLKIHLLEVLTGAGSSPTGLAADSENEAGPQPSKPN